MAIPTAVTSDELVLIRRLYQGFRLDASGRLTRNAGSGRRFLLAEGLPMIDKLLGHIQSHTTACYARLANDPVRPDTNCFAGRIPHVEGRGRWMFGRSCPSAPEKSQSDVLSEPVSVSVGICKSGQRVQLRREAQVPQPSLDLGVLMGRNPVFLVVPEVVHCSAAPRVVVFRNAPGIGHHLW